MRTSGAPFLSRFASTLLVGAILWSPVIPSCAAAARSGALNPAKRKRAPLALARLAQVRAVATDKGVLIEWRTGFEIDNLGFNIYRERNGRREQINPGIIAGSVLIAGQGTALDAGYSYSWFDSAGTLDCKYFLADIDISGKSTLHSAVTPEWSSSLPNFRQSQLLSNLGIGSPGATMQSEWSGTPEEKSRGTSSEAITSATIADQWTIANQPALKIGVRGNGWYRIMQPEMAAASFDTSADARNLRMFVNATEIAIRVSRDSGALAASDYVEFWGQGLDTASTDTQVYWLVNGAQPGKRIVPTAELHADSNPIFQPSPRASQTPGSNFPFGSFTGVGSSSTIADWGTSPPVSRGGGSPTVREGAQPVSSRQKAVSSTQGAVSNELGSSSSAPGELFRGGPCPPLRTGCPRSQRGGSEQLSVPRALAGGSGTKRRAVSSNLKRKGSRRRHRRNHSRSTRARRNHATMVATAPAFIYNVERKDRTVYYSAALNGPAENFFGEILFGDPAPLTLTLHNIETTSATAQLQVALQGVSFEVHQVNAFVNGILLGTISFSDENSVTQTFSVPVSALVEGDNLVKLTPVGSSHDTSIVDYIRLTYPHSFKADGNSLQFSIKSTQSPRIEGFTNANIRVFDITDVTAVQEVRPIVESSGAGFAVTVPAGARGKARRLVALLDTQLSHPASLTLNQPSTLNSNTNVADLLIISYKDFIPALAPLVTQRHDRDGFTVKVVDVEDIYDEFSYGVHTSQAIEDFLSLAKQTWTKAPSYLLLVGDASYDSRNYLGRGFWDFVPSKHVDTLYMEADSDDSLADFDNDGVPEIAVGRLPARTLAEANLMVGKIVNFSPANVPQSALMVADWPNGNDFVYFEEQLIIYLPAGMAVQRVHRPPCSDPSSPYCEPSDAAAHNDIVNKINAGVALVNYSGHGNVDIWAGSIFTSSDALALTNGNKLPFVVVMDCLNGFFSDPVLEGLAESLLKAPNGGAVASFASSGLTIADPQHQMGQRMFQLLYTGPSIAIGDASRQSKTATNDLDVRRTWILFGDPTMKIR